MFASAAPAAGHGWVAAAFPLVAAVVAAVFTVMLGRGYARGRKPFQALWALALAMFAAASFAMFLGVAGGWTASEFRVYWLFGAILNVPYLAMGELYLLIRRRGVAHVLLLILAVGTVFAASKVFAVPLDPAPLAKALPLGKDVFGDESAPYRISQLYAFPAYFLLLGGIVWSAWQMKGRPELRDRTAGTIIIAIGATVVAIGSGVGAGFDVVPLFSASLAAGVALMFAGFLRAANPRRAEAPGAAARVVPEPDGVRE
jgi:hypothetical protein